MAGVQPRSSAASMLDGKLLLHRVEFPRGYEPVARCRVWVFAVGLTGRGQKIARAVVVLTQSGGYASREQLKNSCFALTGFPKLPQSRNQKTSIAHLFPLHNLLPVSFVASHFLASRKL